MKQIKENSFGKMFVCFRFDQTIESARKVAGGDDWNIVYREMQAQLYFLAGTLLLKRAQQVCQPHQIKGCHTLGKNQRKTKFSPGQRTLENVREICHDCFSFFVQFFSFAYHTFSSPIFFNLA